MSPEQLQQEIDRLHGLLEARYYDNNNVTLLEVKKEPESEEEPAPVVKDEYITASESDKEQDKDKDAKSDKDEEKDKDAKSDKVKEEADDPTSPADDTLKDTLQALLPETTTATGSKQRSTTPEASRRTRPPEGPGLQGGEGEEDIGPHQIRREQ
eukprot:s1514_g11.t1